jgi:hypothetical protein
MLLEGRHNQSHGPVINTLANIGEFRLYSSQKHLEVSWLAEAGKTKEITCWLEKQYLLCSYVKLWRPWYTPSDSQDVRGERVGKHCSHNLTFEIHQ